ncbi:hypothetical protein VTP01DRAFT_7841 [Rhizomucor pusillus]|uniref:uncharacterized protein n=1 Tax=Rhizomucor pusillus TaxID=4840 RepID=UPI00374234E8
MGTVLNNCTILEAMFREMEHKTCGVCRGKIVFASRDQSREVLGAAAYCNHCKSFVEQYNSSLRLDMTVYQDDDIVRHVSAFDKSLEPFLGCSMKRLIELARKHPNLLGELEEKLQGLRCHLILKKKQKNMGLPVVDGIIPAEAYWDPHLDSSSSPNA